MGVPNPEFFYAIQQNEKRKQFPPQLFEYVFYIYIEINLYFCGIKGAIEVLGWIADPSLKALTASFLS